MAKCGPHYKPTQDHKEIVEAMAVAGIPQERIAAVLRICPMTLRKHYSDELETSSDKATARVAGALFRKAIGGDVAAAIFWMKTRAGWREKDRLEITGLNGGAIETKRVLPEEDKRLMQEFLGQYAMIGSSQHVRVIEQENGRITDNSNADGAAGPTR